MVTTIGAKIRVQNFGIAAIRLLFRGNGNFERSVVALDVGFDFWYHIELVLGIRFWVLGRPFPKTFPCVF